MEGDILHAKKADIMHMQNLSSPDSGPTKENLIQSIIRTVTQPLSTITESSSVHAQRFVPNGVIVHITAGACPPTTPPCRDPGNESSNIDEIDAKEENQEDETCEDDEEECEDDEEEECEEDEGSGEEEEEECEDEEAEEDCEDIEEPVTKPASPPPPVVPPKIEEDECEECPIHESATDEFCKELPDSEEDPQPEDSPCVEIPRWERKKKSKVIEGECIAEDELKMICKKYRSYDKRPAWKESSKDEEKQVCTCESEEEEEEMSDVCSMEKQFKDPLAECIDADAGAPEGVEEEEEELLFFDWDQNSCPKCKGKVVAPCEEVVKHQETVTSEEVPYFSPTQHFVPWNEEPKPSVQPKQKTQPKTTAVAGSYFGEPKQKKRPDVPAPKKQTSNNTNIYASEGVFGIVNPLTETNNENLRSKEVKHISRKSDYIAEQYFGPYKSPNYNNNYNVGNANEYSSEYTGNHAIEHSDSESSAYTTYVKTAPSTEEASGGFWHGDCDSVSVVARNDDSPDNKHAYAEGVDVTKMNMGCENAVEYSKDELPVQDEAAQYLTEPEYSDFTLSDTNNQHCLRSNDHDDATNVISPYTADDAITKTGKYNGYDIACIGDEDIYFEKGDELESLSDASYCSSNEKSPKVEQVFKHDRQNIPVVITRDESPDCMSCASSISDRDSSPDGRYRSPHRVRASTSERFIIEALEDCDDESDIEAMIIPKVSSMSALGDQSDNNITSLSIKLASFTSSPIENFKRLFTTFTKKALGIEDDYVPKTESRRESVRKEHVVIDREKRSIKRDHSRSVTITSETYGQDILLVNSKPPATPEHAVGSESASQQTVSPKDVVENSNEDKSPASKDEEKENPLNFQNVLSRIVDAFKPSETRTYNGPYREGTRQFKRSASTSPGRTKQSNTQKKTKTPKTQNTSGNTHNESAKKVVGAEHVKENSSVLRKVVEVGQVIERSIVTKKVVDFEHATERSMVSRNVVSPVSSVMAMQEKDAHPKEVKRSNVAMSEGKVPAHKQPKGRNFSFGMFHKTRVLKKEEKPTKNTSLAFRALKSKSDKTLTSNDEKEVRVQPFLSRNKRISSHREEITPRPTFENRATGTNAAKAQVTNYVTERPQESPVAKKDSPVSNQIGRDREVLSDIKKFIENHALLLENNSHDAKPKINEQLECKKEKKDPVSRTGHFTRKSLKSNHSGENAAPNKYKWKSSRKIEQHVVISNGHKLTEYKNAKRIKSQQNPPLPTDCDIDSFHERTIAIEMCESINRKRQRVQNVSYMPQLLSTDFNLTGDGAVSYAAQLSNGTHLTDDGTVSFVPQLMSNTAHLTGDGTVRYVPQSLSNNVNVMGDGNMGNAPQLFSNTSNSSSDGTASYTPQPLSNSTNVAGDGGQASGITRQSGMTHSGLWFPDVPVNIVKTQELYRNMKQTNSLMDEIITLTKQGQIATAIQKFRSQEQSARNSSSCDENDSDSSSSLDNSATSDEDVKVNKGAYLPYMDSEDRDIGDSEAFLSPNTTFFDQIDVILQVNDNINENKGTESLGEIASGQCSGNTDEKIKAIIHQNFEKADVCRSLVIKYPKTFDFTNRAKQSEVEQCNFSHELTDTDTKGRSNLRSGHSASRSPSPRTLPFKSQFGNGGTTMEKKRDGVMNNKTSKLSMSPHSSRYDSSTSSKGSGSQARRKTSGHRSQSSDKPKPRTRSPSAHAVSEVVDLQNGSGFSRTTSKNNSSESALVQPGAAEPAGERPWPIAEEKLSSSTTEDTHATNADTNKAGKNDKSSSSWKYMTRWRPPDDVDTEPDLQSVSKQQSDAESQLIDLLKKKPNSSNVELASQMRDKTTSKNLKYVEARPRWRSPRGELRHQANSSKTKVGGKLLKGKDVKQKKSASQKVKQSPSRGQTSNYSARRYTDSIVTNYDSNKFRSMLQEPKRRDSQPQENKTTQSGGHEGHQHTPPKDSKNPSNTHQDSKYAHNAAMDARQMHVALIDARQVGVTHQEGKPSNGAHPENQLHISNNEEVKEKPVKIDDQKSEDKKRQPVRYSTVNYSPAKDKIAVKTAGKDKSQGDAKKRDKKSPHAVTRVRTKSPIRGKGYSKSEHFMKNRAPGTTSPVPVDAVGSARPQSIGSKFRALVPEKVTASRSQAAAIKETASRASILKPKKDDRQKINIKKPDPKKVKSELDKAVTKASPKQQEEVREVEDYKWNYSTSKAYDIPPSILNEGGTLLDSVSRAWKTKTEPVQDNKGKEPYLHQFRSYTPSPTLVKPKHSFHKVETPYFGTKARRSETELSSSGSGVFFQSRVANVERPRNPSPMTYQYSAPPQRDDHWFTGHVRRDSPTGQNIAYDQDSYKKQVSEKSYASEDSYYNSPNENSYRQNTDIVFSKPKVDQDSTDYSTYADFKNKLSFHAISNSNLSNTASAIRSNYAVAQPRPKPREPPEQTVQKSSKSYGTPTQLSKEPTKKPTKAPTPETLSPSFLPQDETPNEHSMPEPEKNPSTSDGPSFQLGMLSRLFNTFTRQSAPPAQTSSPERSSTTEKSGDSGKKTSNGGSDNRNSSNRANTNRNNRRGLKWTRSNFETICLENYVLKVDSMEFQTEMLMNFNSNATVSYLEKIDKCVVSDESIMVYTDELMDNKGNDKNAASLIEYLGNTNSNAESRKRKRDEEIDQSMSEMGSSFDEVEFDRFEEARRKDPDQPIYRLNKCLAGLTSCVESGEHTCNTLNTLLEWNIVLLIVIFILFLGLLVPGSLHNIIVCPVPSLSHAIHAHFLEPLGLDIILAKWMEPTKNSFWQFQFGAKEPTKGIFYSFLYQVIVISVRLILYVLIYIFIPIMSVPFLIIGPVLSALINATSCTVSTIWNTIYATFDNTLHYMTSLVSSIPSSSPAPEKDFSGMKSYPSYTAVSSNEANDAGDYADVTKNLHSLRKHGSFLFYFGFDQPSEKCKYSFLKATYLWLTGQFPMECL